MNQFARSTAVAVIACLACTLGYAQATRTWVSGVGDDANPCSRTAPCKTFAGAISKTAAGGEISALDPGGFGAVTIVKSITLSGDGDLASILVSGTNGVTVNTQSVNDVVTLRHISINGIGGTGSGGTNGVAFIGAGTLVIEDCTINGFTVNGVDVAGGVNVSIRNTTITNANSSATNAGVRIEAAAGPVNVSLDNVSLRTAANGLWSSSGTISVSHSTLSQNSATGVLADNGSGVSLLNNTLTGNGIAVQASGNAVIRLSNNDVLDNVAGFRCDTGGALSSAGNNHKANNLGTGTACSPTLPAISMQ